MSIRVKHELTLAGLLKYLVGAPIVFTFVSLAVYLFEIGMVYSMPQSHWIEYKKLEVADGYGIAGAEETTMRSTFEAKTDVSVNWGDELYCTVLNKAGDKRVLSIGVANWTTIQKKDYRMYNPKFWQLTIKTPTNALDCHVISKITTYHKAGIVKVGFVTSDVYPIVSSEVSK